MLGDHMTIKGIVVGMLDTESVTPKMTAANLRYLIHRLNEFCSSNVDPVVSSVVGMLRTSFVLAQDNLKQCKTIGEFSKIYMNIRKLLMSLYKVIDANLTSFRITSYT